MFKEFNIIEQWIYIILFKTYYKMDASITAMTRFTDSDCLQDKTSTTW